MIQAAEKGAPSKPKSTVLDFEADVIEGEKRKPDLFIQMEGSIESMDSVLYSRDDFNDYHELDRKWRPKIRRLKGGGAVKP
jgi:hypothetical protein